MELDPAAQLDLYRVMTTIRQCDDRFDTLLRAGTIAIGYYSPRGQEAIAAGVASTLRSSDYLVTTYRGLHDQIAKGVPLRDLWAEYLGRATGPCKGKGGPMHLTYPGCGLMVTTGIVGAGLPIANGLALASQVQGDGRVTVCNFGDGATNIGAFHESLNLAALWHLPVVFVCQNNHYAEHTRYEDGTSAAHVIDRAASYGMPAVAINGNDPLAVRAATQRAVERARDGDGPTLVEAETYRLRGHTFGDEAPYVPDAHRELGVANDPIPAFRAVLIAASIATDGELSAIEDAARSDIADAERYALDSPYPDTAEVLTDVYAMSQKVGVS